MDDRISDFTSNASVQQLRRLLELVLAEPEIGPVEQFADTRVLADILAGIENIGLPDAGRFVNAVLDEKSPLALLEAVHNCAREMGEGTDNPEQRAAANLLEQAAVAAVLSRHKLDIGNETPAARTKTFARLGAALGNGSLADLFAAAASITPYPDPATPPDNANKIKTPAA